MKQGTHPAAVWVRTFSLLMADAEKEGKEWSSEVLGPSALKPAGAGGVVEGPSVVAHV